MRFIIGLFQAALLCLLVACGGGGGGGGSNPSGNSISLDTQAIAMNIAPGTPSNSHNQTVVVTFRGAGVVVGIPPGAPALPNWLYVSPGNVNGNTVPITIGYAPNLGIGIGRYAYTLRFATGNADGTSVAYRDVPLVVTVMPQVWPEAATVQTAVGNTVQTQDIRFSWGELPWAVRTSAPWLTVDRSSGGQEWDTVVRVTMNPAGLAPGEYTGTVFVEETVGHVAQEMPVRMIVEPRQLLVRQRGIALSQVGTQARLSASVKIADNGNLGMGWSASSDQPWLTLGASTGTTAPASNTLAVQANIAGLADGMHYARVTVAPRNETTPSNSVTVRVGLYVNRGATYPATATIPGRVLTQYPPFYARGLVADPIRPYVYQTFGDGQVDVYNTHTGMAATAITIPGAGLGAMAVSPDGSTLYVVDHLGPGVYPVNLDTQVVGSRLNGLRVPTEMAYTEVGGRRVLLTGELQAVDAQTGAVLADADDPNFPYDRNQSVAVRRDGRAVFFQTDSGANHQLSRYTLSNVNGQFSMRRTHIKGVSGDGRGLAVDATDERVYELAPGATVGFPLPTGYRSGFVYEAGGNFLELGGIDTCCTNGLAVSSRGQVVMGQGNGYPSNVTVLNADGTALTRRDLDTGYYFQRLAVSGDGRRVIVDGGDLRLFDLP